MANAGETGQADEVATKPAERRPRAERAAPGVTPPVVATSSPLGLGGPPAPAPAPKAKTSSTPAVTAAPAEPLPRMYEVLEDKEVPREGSAGTYQLRKGQKIKQGGYNIPFLQQVGVRLREVAPVPRRVIVTPPSTVVLPSTAREESSEPEVLADVYEVAEAIDVPRSDGLGTFRLGAGQRVKQGGYNIQWLLDHDVRLVKIEPKQTKRLTIETPGAPVAAAK